MTDLIELTIPSLIGDLSLTASNKGVRSITWPEFMTAEGSRDRSVLADSSLAAKHLAAAVQQLEDYFAGGREKFELTFDVEGTDFQKRVWAALTLIPYGKTISYRELANAIGQPAAVRAVGSANGKNPLMILVPCHRVIASDGTLGGYSGSLTRKQKLLDHERRRL